jgi:hypothetical protein
LGGQKVEGVVMVLTHVAQRCRRELEEEQRQEAQSRKTRQAGAEVVQKGHPRIIAKAPKI